MISLASRKLELSAPGSGAGWVRGRVLFEGIARLGKLELDAPVSGHLDKGQLVPAVRDVCVCACMLCVCVCVCVCASARVCVNSIGYEAECHGVQRGEQ